MQLGVCIAWPLSCSSLETVSALTSAAGSAGPVYFHLESVTFRPAMADMFMECDLAVLCEPDLGDIDMPGMEPEEPDIDMAPFDVLLDAAAMAVPVEVGAGAGAAMVSLEAGTTVVASGTRARASTENTAASGCAVRRRRGRSGLVASGRNERQDRKSDQGHGEGVRWDPFPHRQEFTEALSGDPVGQGEVSDWGQGDGRGEGHPQRSVRPWGTSTSRL